MNIHLFYYINQWYVHMSNLETQSGIHLNWAISRSLEEIEKIQKKATKLIISLNKWLCYGRGTARRACQ